MKRVIESLNKPAAFDRVTIAIGCAAFLCGVVMVMSLSGCSSQAGRMAECQAQGISRDACYMAEQNRKAAITGASEKQAMENARAATQHAQAAKKRPNETACATITDIYNDGGVEALSQPGIELYNLCHPGEDITKG